MTNKSRLVSSRRDSRVMHKCVHINIVINANKAGELPTGPTVCPIMSVHRAQWAASTCQPVVIFSYYLCS